MNKFKRLYRCMECGKGTLFSRREENRAARLRCTGCGSARLEMSNMGAEKQKKANQTMQEVKERINSNESGSIIPA